MTRGTKALTYGSTMLAASGLTVAGSLLPWHHLIQCYDVCFEARTIDWNVLQSGGGSSGPSLITAVGVVILLGAAIQAASGVFAIVKRDAGRVTPGWAAAALVASLAILVASFLAPVPTNATGGRFGFVPTADGIGKWIAVAGGAIGLVASVVVLLRGGRINAAEWRRARPLATHV